MSEEVKVTETENAVGSAAKESDKIDEAIAQPDETPEKQGILEEILNSIGNMEGFEGFEEIAALLTLPEEQFAMLKEIFLQTLDQGFNVPAERLKMVQALNASSVSVEDFKAMGEDLIEEIENQLKEALSAQKRDFLKRIIGLTLNAVNETEGIAKRLIRIPVEKSNDNAKMPVYAHLTDAGADLYALEEIIIAPGETKLIPTGLKMAIPAGYELQVRPKSGMSLKTKLRVGNAPGTIKVA